MTSSLSPSTTTSYLFQRTLTPSPPAVNFSAPPGIRSHSSLAFYDDALDSSLTSIPLIDLAIVHAPRHPSISASSNIPVYITALPARYASVPYGRVASAHGSPRGSTSLTSSNNNNDNSSVTPYGALHNTHTTSNVSLVAHSYTINQRASSTSPASSLKTPSLTRHSELSENDRLRAFPLPMEQRRASTNVIGAVRSGSLRLPAPPQRAPLLTLARHARSESSPNNSGTSTPQFPGYFSNSSLNSQSPLSSATNSPILPTERENDLESIRRHHSRPTLNGVIASAPLPRRKLPEVPKAHERSEDDSLLHDFEDFLRYNRVSSEAAGTRSAARASMRLALSPKISRDETFASVNFLSVKHSNVYRKTSENNLAISHYRNDNNNEKDNKYDRPNHNQRGRQCDATNFDLSLKSDNKRVNTFDDGKTRSSSLYVHCYKMGPPPRSQSFRHRARPVTLGAAAAAIASDARRPPLEELGERRRSTPTIHRRSSLQQKNRMLDRTDVWPEPKQMSEIEERFLRLPDFEDYTRVRQFRIDSKGAVVSRGDSFRRKRHANVSQSNSCNFERTPPKNESSLSPFPTSDSDSARTPHRTVTTAVASTCVSESRSTSVSSNDSANITNKMTKLNKRDGLSDGAASLPTTDDGSLIIEDAPSTSHPSYKVYILGQSGAGKSSLVSQFVSSEYRNAFTDEIEEICNATTVSVNIGGLECDLNFYESDPNMDPYWIEESVSAYVLVYSIDRKSSFRTVVNALETIRSKRKSVPIILAGNKIDLERKRTVSAHEVKCVALTYDVVHFEISVALNHDIDDLLVGIVAEIRESVGTLYELGSVSSGGKNVTSCRAKHSVKYNDENSAIVPPNAYCLPCHEPEEFRAAIRRFSQRKKRQMGTGGGELDDGKCANLNPVGLFEKFRQWRRGISKC